MRRELLIVIAVSVSFLCGCGSQLPTVQGTVTLDDAPVPNGTVVFESPDRATAIAKTNDDGRYEMMTASKRGMAAGDYSVAISAYETRDGGSESPIPVLRTPKKYNSAATSGLSATIADGKNEVDFQLKSSP